MTGNGGPAPPPPDADLLLWMFVVDAGLYVGALRHLLFAGAGLRWAPSG